MTVTEPTSDPVAAPSELRDRALANLKKRQDFRVHLLVFALFNLGVWAIWLWTGSGFPWPAFMTFFWGVGVIMNAYDVYWKKPISEADVQREIEHLRG